MVAGAAPNGTSCLSAGDRSPVITGSICSAANRPAGATMNSA